jgi:periplasmic mercuric ion binding protein
MRILRLTAISTMSLFSVQTSSAQVVVTESFKVILDCTNESCKKQIETSMVKNGAKKADWDIETKTITVTYDPRKVTVEDVRKRIEIMVSENGGKTTANTLAKSNKNSDK